MVTSLIYTDILGSKAEDKEVKIKKSKDEMYVFTGTKLYQNTELGGEIEIWIDSFSGRLGTWSNRIQIGLRRFAN